MHILCTFAIYMPILVCVCYALVVCAWKLTVEVLLQVMIGTCGAPEIPLHPS